MILSEIFWNNITPNTRSHKSLTLPSKPLIKSAQSRNFQYQTHYVKTDQNLSLLGNNSNNCLLMFIMVTIGDG